MCLTAVVAVLAAGRGKGKRRGHAGLESRVQHVFGAKGDEGDRGEVDDDGEEQHQLQTAFPNLWPRRPVHHPDPDRWDGHDYS